MLSLWFNLFLFSLEAMQFPDVVVANLDTNSFSSKQTVHVNEVYINILNLLIIIKKNILLNCFIFFSKDINLKVI